MRDRLRVAVVGMGIGQAHVYGYTRRKDLFEVAVLCDVDQARMAPIAERLRGVTMLTDFDALCARDDVDVVSICTPPHLHGSQVAAALRSGKHVVCEKPLVGSMREVDELAELEASSEVRLMPIFQYRYGHGLQKLAALVDAGIAGRALTASIEVAWRRRPDYYAVPWRGRWETELGGLLVSHCVHALDMATYVMGDPVRVFARTATRVNDIETEDCASASIEVAGGGYITLSATLGSASEISRHRFCFDHLVAESNTEAYTNSSDPWVFTGDDADVQGAIDATLGAFVSEAEDYQRQFELFHAAVTAGTALPVTLHDARRSIELVTAMYASAGTGADITVPISASDPRYAGWRG